MPRKWSKKSPRERKRLAVEAVLNLLPHDGSELRWTALRLKAEAEGMSSATLRNHLKRFVQVGIAQRRMDLSTYPPGVYYCRTRKDILADAFTKYILVSMQFTEIGDLSISSSSVETVREVKEAMVAIPTKLLAAYWFSVLYTYFYVGARAREQIRRDVAHDLLGAFVGSLLHDTLDLMTPLGIDERMLSKLRDEYAHEALIETNNLEATLTQLREEIGKEGG